MFFSKPRMTYLQMLWYPLSLHKSNISRFNMQIVSLKRNYWKMNRMQMQLGMVSTIKVRQTKGSSQVTVVRLCVIVPVCFMPDTSTHQTIPVRSSAEPLQALHCRLCLREPCDNLTAT